MRIAFFGGSFDPPHCGHLAVARAALDRLALDRVLMAPVGNQPLKQNVATPSNFDDRLAMVRLATAADSSLHASDLDRPRADGRPNYTLDSVLELRSTLVPDDSLFCLIGADSFLTLRKWYRAEELLLLAPFIVAGRPGFTLEDAAAALPENMRPGEPADGPGYRVLQISDDRGRQTVLYLMPDLQIDISATMIRAALAEGANAQTLLPQAVLEYIRARGLYR